MLPVQFPFLGLGHDQEIQRKPNNSDTRKCKECRTVSGIRERIFW